MARALIVSILADAKQFGAELDRAAGKTRQFSKAAGVAGLALAGGLAYGVEKSVKAASQFQSSMQLLTTQAGVSQKAVAGLSQGVLGLAGPTATAPNELAAGIYHLASQGLRGKQALDALRIAAEGATVGQANLEDVTNALGGVIASGIKGSGDLKQVMGELNATVGAGDMRMQDLADAMGTGLASNAATAQVNIHDVSAALAVFGDNNIRGAKAGTALGSALRLMSAPSSTAQKELATIGVGADDLAKRLAGKGGLVGALEFLKAQMVGHGLNAIQQGQLLSNAFGGKQATGVKLLMNEMDRLKKKEEEVKAGAGGFGHSWKATTETTAFKFNQLKQTLSALAINLGTALLPAINKVADALGVAAGWLEKHKTLAEALVIGLGVLATTLIAVSVATTIVTAATTLWGAAMTIATGPIGLVIAAVALLAAGAYELYKHWGAVTQFFHHLWDDIKKVFFAALDWLEGHWKIFLGLPGLIWQYWGTISDFFSRLWDGIKNVFSGVIDWIKSAFVTFVNWLIDGINKLIDAYNAVAGWLTGNIPAIGHIGQQTGQAYGNALSTAVTGATSDLGSKIQGALSGVKPQIEVKLMATAGDAVMAAVMGGGAIHGGKSLTIGGGGGHAGGGPVVKNKRLPGHAAGGIFTQPHLAWIAENGPEAIIPLTAPGRMNGETPLGSLGGGGDLNLTVLVPLADGRVQRENRRIALREVMRGNAYIGG